MDFGGNGEAGLWWEEKAVDWGLAPIIKIPLKSVQPQTEASTLNVFVFFGQSTQSHTPISSKRSADLTKTKLPDIWQFSPVAARTRSLTGRIRQMWSSPMKATARTSPQEYLRYVLLCDILWHDLFFSSVHLPDRHHVVPFWRPELWDEVRKLDVQWF